MHYNSNAVLYEKIGLQLENQLGSLKKILIDLNLIELEVQSKGLKSGPIPFSNQKLFQI